MITIIPILLSGFIIIGLISGIYLSIRGIARCPAGSHQGKGGNALFVDGSVAWFSSESQRSPGSGGTSFEQLIKTGKDEPLGQ
jgi:prepilin-type processing-associated H-X9-DG protein